MKSLRFLSLYSGIGMHDLGFERAGWQCVGQVEIDPFCRAVLEKHWPKVPRWADVRDVSANTVIQRCGRPDIITGGFACQDISIAGQGAGLTRTTRSGITWRNLFRLVRSVRPFWIVVENVPALRTRGYDRCARVLERIGYTLRAIVVGACDVGAPQLRRRVWIVGCLLHADDARLQRSIGGWLQAAETRQRQGRRDHESVRSALGSWPHGPAEIGRVPKETDGHARGMVRFTRDSSTHAYGNGNPPQVAELVARTINAARGVLDESGVLK